MIDFKILAENILKDLMGSASIAEILLKTKIYASNKRDEILLQWVTQELGGYEERPPIYRILDAGVKVQVFAPFRGIYNIEFPIDYIDDEKVRERLSKMAFHNPISELETLSHTDGDSDTLICRIPTMVYPFMKPFINGNIQDAYQYVSKASAANIIVSVKSVLIDYFLKVNNKEEIDFNTFIQKEDRNIQINNTTYKYYGSIINTGDGTVSAQGANVVIGNNNTTIQSSKEKLQQILSEIEKLTAPVGNTDVDDAIADIKAELQKEYPAFGGLKNKFKVIPSFLMGTATSLVANGISPLVKKAIDYIATKC